MNIINSIKFTRRSAFTALTSLLIFAGLVLPLTALAQESIDKIIAIVDDDVILQSEFDARQAQVVQQIAERNIAPPPDEELSKQIMDQLIIEHLQTQMAFRAGIRVDDNMLNQALGNIAQQNNMSFEQFRQLLERDGVYALTREQIRKDITINQLQSGAVSQRINITRQEVENYLRSEAGLADIAPEYHVAHLLIPTSTGATQQQQLADLLYQRLQEGSSNILQIAGVGQISRITVNGGDLGWNKVEDLPTLFQPIVPDLDSNEVTPPFSSPAGFHIVQLLETRGGVDLQVDQEHVRHIMIVPNEIRTEAQSETFIRELYQRIIDGEDFSDIARQNTDDTASMVSGGDLDWINDGQLPQEYMDIIHTTAVGEMTEPFRVSTGWHIVEVLGRRTEDVTEQNKRFQAQQTLRDRKYENELQNWLTEIRDVAYIDLKEE